MHAEDLAQQPDPLIDFYFLTASAAAKSASRGYPVMEQLRQGHGVLSPMQFVSELHAGNIEVLALPNECFVLVCWGTCAEGNVMNILTTVGSMEHASHAITCYEEAARSRKADVVMSVGHPGWSKLVKQHGYEVTTRILMKKVL